MKTLRILPLLLLLSLAPGCATLDPKADPVEVRAEQAVSIAFSTFDTFLKLELAQEARLKKSAPACVDFAKWLTERQPDGKARGLSLIESANNVRRAYKLNRSPENRASLISALAAIESALAETQKQLANAH